MVKECNSGVHAQCRTLVNLVRFSSSGTLPKGVLPCVLMCGQTKAPNVPRWTAATATDCVIAAVWALVILQRQAGPTGFVDGAALMTAVHLPSEE